MMAFSFTARRRAKALPQIAALALSVSVAFQASLCPPGMDAGMDMGMPEAASAETMDGRPAGHEAGTHCRFAGSSDEDGRPTCPFSLGGIGPCGTTAPVPSVTLDALLAAVLRQPPLFVHVIARADIDLRIQPRPPRA